MEQSFENHSGWSQRGRLLRQVPKDPLEYGAATEQHDGNVRIFANINVALRRTVVGLVGFFAKEIWLEQ